MAPDGLHAYVANRESNTLSVIAVATNTVVATVSVGRAPLGVAVSLNSATVYVTNEQSASVSVINAATNKVTATVTVGNTPNGVDVTPDGTKVYVANVNSGTVSVIAAATNTVTSTVQVGNGPEAFGEFITPVAVTTPLPIPNQQSGTKTIVVSPHEFPYKVTFETRCTFSLAGHCLNTEVVRTCVGGNCFDVPQRDTGPACVKCDLGLGALGGAAVQGAAGLGALYCVRRRPDGV